VSCPEAEIRRAWISESSIRSQLGMSCYCELLPIAAAAANVCVRVSGQIGD